MLKYLIFVFALVFGVLIWINFGVGVPDIYSEEINELAPPHRYNDSRQSIGIIKIVSLYFVPQNRISQQSVNWKNPLEQNLKKMQEFHSLQFQRRSIIKYEILDKPIIGLLDNLEYDSDSTQHGNPEGLRRISAEIEKRLINPGGDLYRPDLAKGNPSEYRVFLILYEGVGASGSENIALASNTFMIDPQYESTRTTIIAHEIYHTLGIPDFYEIPTAIPTSFDIMGLGLSRPIDKTFISRETLKKMGI